MSGRGRRVDLVKVSGEFWIPVHCRCAGGSLPKVPWLGLGFRIAFGRFVLVVVVSGHWITLEMACERRAVRVSGPPPVDTECVWIRNMPPWIGFLVGVAFRWILLVHVSCHPVSPNHVAFWWIVIAVSSLGISSLG